MPRVAALLFDLDGTLIDSRADIAASANYVRSYFGRDPLEVRAVAAMIGDGLRALMGRVVADMAEVDVDESIICFRTHYEQHCVDATTVYDGVMEALQALASIPKVVVTTTPESLSRKICDELHLAPHFKGIVGGDTCLTKKPDPEPIREALRLVGGDADAPAAIVGDGDTDIAAGHAAGITTCAVSWGIGDKSRLYEQRPHLLAETPADLVELFKA